MNLHTYKRNITREIAQGSLNIFVEIESIAAKIKAHVTLHEYEEASQYALAKEWLHWQILFTTISDN